VPPFDPEELARFLPDLLGDEAEKEALRLNEGRRSRSLWSTFGCLGLPSTTAAAPGASPELVPGRDLAGDDDATLLLLLLPPLNSDEKNGAAVCVGVAPDRCMSQLAAFALPGTPCNYKNAPFRHS